MKKVSAANIREFARTFLTIHGSAATPWRAERQFVQFMAKN